MPEEVRQRARNCFGCNPKAGSSLGIEWAPELEECPWSAIPAAAWVAVRWWTDWKTAKVLPYGARSLGQLPAYMTEAIMLVDGERAAKRARDVEQMKQDAQRPKGSPKLPIKR